MATRSLEKLASIDAQLRALVPGKVSEDDKLVEYDALLLDRFLDILQDLHGEDLKETVCIICFPPFCCYCLILVLLFEELCAIQAITV
uniref:Phosphoenolpyruvate carboxylase-like n=1 Tax=Nicotiana tabacum TaxID=4097 RepID=A0A1S3XC28_TOBAC|nr:PREDICTED: phosphoenolpyruvate carboxylase-like [Nicotiana tabacum]